MIRLAQVQAGDAAGEGSRNRGRALGGLGGQRHRGIDRRIPNHAVLGRIGHAQADDRAIAHGCSLGNIRDRLGGDRRRNQRSESDIIAVGGAGDTGGIGAHMVQRARDQPGHGAGKGAGGADWAIRGFAIRDGGSRLQCSRLHRVRSDCARPKSRDVAVAGGGGRGNVRDCLGSDGGSQQRGENDILTISRACRIGGIRPHMIQRIGGQAGDVAGEGPGGADRAIRGFGARYGRIGGKRPDKAVLGGIGNTQSGNISVAGGDGGQNVRGSLGRDGGYNQARESDLLAIHGGCTISGICAHMIERTRGQAGHRAGEGSRSR